MMERRQIDCGDGSMLEYFVAGTSGPALVCINALGQNLLVWSRLIEHFSRSHRVLCWKPRGTYERTGRQHTLWDQVADLERIVDEESVEQCRMVTWCSGAKVGLEFARRRPIVSSLVLTNGTFKALPGLEHLETTFEQVLLQLCQAVARRPELATMMMKSMRSLLSGTAPGLRGNQELKNMIVEPFESEQSTLQYSLQVVDYLSHDIGPALSSVKAPALLISGQLDTISSPGMSKAVTERLPDARYGEIAGGTHYCLYENPARMIDLLERFFAAPRELQVQGMSAEVGLG
jgi:pimeloyl-ACP methyl ester carboxylesterase